MAERSWSGLEEIEAVIRRLSMAQQLLQLDGGNLGGGVVAITIGPLRLFGCEWTVAFAAGSSLAGVLSPRHGTEGPGQA
jgi:hypothetical protein